MERAELRPGEVVAVLGASGSTGGASIQLAKTLDATVVAVAGSEEKLSFCAGIGADHLVNRRTGDVGEQLLKVTDGRGVDVIVDLVGGEVAAQSVTAIARYGRVAVVGYASGSFLAVDPLDLLMRNYSAVGVLAAGFTDAEESAAYDRLVDLTATGAVTPPIGTVASLRDIPDVVAGLTSAAPGKVVIRTTD